MQVQYGRRGVKRTARQTQPLKKRKFKQRGFLIKKRNPLLLAAIRRPEVKYVDGYLDNTGVAEISTNDDDWAGCELNPRQQTAVYGCLPCCQ